LLHDATEAEDTSGRQFLFELLEGAVRKVCGHNVDSEYDRGRAMFGIWNTQFLIPTESHTEENRRALQTELGRIYHAHKDIVRGFRLVWEGDRQDAMVDDTAAAMKRFGDVKFNLGKQFFSHLREPDSDDID